MVFYLFKASGLIFVYLLFSSQHVQGQTNRVSSKLDFDEAQDNNNSTVPFLPGLGQGRAGDGRRSSEGGSEGGYGNNTNSNNADGGGGGKSGPKIHGVRVTVDTGDAQNAKESKESVEITDLGKHKKRVGIHTDITFEITADGDDGNATSSAQREEKEDASVPIYKGRGGSTHKSRKPYDPKTRWNPNFSSERRGYDGIGRSYGGSSYGGPSYGGPSYAGSSYGGSSYGDYYPQYRHNIPGYMSSGDSRAGGDSVYRRDDGWTSHSPSQWTTERNHYEPHRPNAVTGYRTQPSWKPCYCITTTITDNRRRRDSVQDSSVTRPTSSIIEVVDGKLERPFSKK